MMGAEGMVVFWILLGTYIMGFRAFAMGEDKKISLVGLILFFLSPIVFPFLLLILFAKLLVDTLRSF